MTVAKKSVVVANNNSNGITDKNIKGVREFINKQTYTVGGSVLTNGSGTGEDFDIKVGGEARWLYGINLYSERPDDIVTLIINNENILINVPEIFYDVSYNTKGRNFFFELPRPLSGNDVVTLNVKSTASHAFQYAFYLSKKSPVQL